jgi:hypothetical protein
MRALVDCNGFPSRRIPHCVLLNAAFHVCMPHQVAQLYVQNLLHLSEHRILEKITFSLTELAAAPLTYVATA